MSMTMELGRYVAELEYDPDEKSFYGRSINVRPGGFDFWGTSVEELLREFAASARVFEEFAAERGIAISVKPIGQGRKASAARALGRSKSPAKAAAARKNGMKGGRPRRTPSAPATHPAGGGEES